MCGCLVHPCNWFLFMVISINISISANVFCFVFKPCDPEDVYVFFQVLMVGNSITSLIFLIHIFRVYRKLRSIYLGLRCEELYVFDRCVQAALRNLQENKEV